MNCWVRHPDLLPNNNMKTRQHCLMSVAFMCIFSEEMISDYVLALKVCARNLTFLTAVPT